MKTKLRECTRPQLIALGVQKTEIPYLELLSMDKDTLVNRLSEVKNIFVTVIA